MRRWALLFALLVSAGLNAGILATLWVTRETTPPPAAVGPEEPANASGGLQPRASGEGEPASDVTSPAPTALVDGPPSSAPSAPATPSSPPAAGEFGHPIVGAPIAPVPVPTVPAIPLGGGAELPPTPPRLLELANRLGLQGEKRQRFLDQQLGLMVTMRDGRWRIQKLRRELHDLLFAAKPNEREIARRLDEIAGLQLALERKTAETLIASRQLLTPAAEQIYLDFFRRLRLFAPGPVAPGGAARPGLAPPDGRLDGNAPSDLETGPGERPDGGESGAGLDRPRLERRPLGPAGPAWRIEQRRRRLDPWRPRWQGPRPGSPGPGGGPEPRPGGGGGNRPGLPSAETPSDEPPPEPPPAT